MAWIAVAAGFRRPRDSSGHLRRASGSELGFVSRRVALTGLLMLSLGALILTPAATPTPALALIQEAASPPCRTYTVQPGDWVDRIASDHGYFTVQELIRLNPSIVAPDFLITPGQVLVLPEPSEPGPAAESGSSTVTHGAVSSEGSAETVRSACQVYVVQSGDWVDHIAELHGILVADLLAANPSVVAPDFLISPGQVLVLPPAAAPVLGVEPVARTGSATPEVAAAPEDGGDAGTSEPLGAPEAAEAIDPAATAEPSPDETVTAARADRDRDTLLVGVAALLGGIGLGIIVSWIVGRRRRFVRLG